MFSLLNCCLRMQRKKLAALKRVERYEKDMLLLRSKLGGTSSECVAAYVIFNNEESALRCIDDYKYVRPAPPPFLLVLP